MEPNYTSINVLALVLPFGAYYVGILIRYRLWSNPAASLGDQLLLGIPVSLVVVSTLLLTVFPTASTVPSYLLSLGIVIEQGMVLNETAVSQLRNLATGGSMPVPVAVPNSQTTALQR